MAGYPVVTISHLGEVRPGAIVGIYSPREGEEIPAITLGSDNSGYRAFLPVKLRREERKQWEAFGLAIISAAAVKKAKIGYCLVSREANTTSKIITVITAGGRATGLDGEGFPGRILARGLVLEDDPLDVPGEQLVVLVPDRALFKVAWDSSELFYRAFGGTLRTIYPQAM